MASGRQPDRQAHYYRAALWAFTILTKYHFTDFCLNNGNNG